MSKEVQLPDPKTEDYQLKDAQISLLTGTETEYASFAVFDFGQTLGLNPSLTSDQQVQLLANLKRGRLLTYQAEFNADLQNASQKKKEVLQSTKDQTLWDLENIPHLQAGAIVAASKLSTSTSLAERLQISVSLLRDAQNVSRGYILFVPFDYQTSVHKSLERENEISQLKETYITEMINQGLTDEHDLWYAQNETTISLPTDLADKLMAYHLLQDINAKNTIEIFHQLQDVLYEGYAEGIRQAIKNKYAFPFRSDIDF